MKKVIFLTAIILIHLSGCVVYRPDSEYVSETDYNKRVEIRNAHYDKVITPVGIGSIIAGTAAAGYAGYQFGSKANLFAYYEGAQRKTVDAGGAVVGAFVGLTLTFLANKALGWGNYKSIESQVEWLKRTNKNFIPIRSSGNYTFFAMHRNAENEFAVKNIQDARDFSTAFTNQSAYVNDICKQTINNSGLYRADYYELLGLFPTNSYTLDMKKNYVLLSQSVTDLFGAVDRFPETKLDVESQASNLVMNCSDAFLFHGRYKQSRFNRKVVMFGINSCTDNEIRTLKNDFGSDFYLTENDFKKYQVSEKIKANYMNAQFVTNSVNNLYDVEYLYRKYKWLKYNEKSNEILNKYWEIGYRTVANGNELLGIIKSLATGNNYSDWDIRTYIVDKFLQQKLNEEIKDKIRISQTGIQTPSNSNWDKWCSNQTITAGMITSKEDVKCVVYGNVINNSKFDLPLRIDAAADLTRKSSVQGTGKWTNGLVAAMALYERTSTSSKSYIGTMNESFYIPTIKSGKSEIFAVLFDCEQKAKQGVNINDWFKFKFELNFENFNYNAAYDNSQISVNTINQQNQWYTFAQNGFPESEIVDTWRNKTFDQTEWDEKHRRQVEAEIAAHKRWEAERPMREARERAERESNNENEQQEETERKNEELEVEKKKKEEEKEAFEHENKVKDDCQIASWDTLRKDDDSILFGVYLKGGGTGKQITYDTKKKVYFFTDLIVLKTKFKSKEEIEVYIVNDCIKNNK